MVASENILFRLRFFLIVLLIFWIGLAVLLVVHGYEGSFRLMNHHRYIGFNYFSLIFTHLADLMVLVPILFVLSWDKDKSILFLALIAIIATGIVAQMLKHWVFGDWHRPPAVFEGDSGIFILSPKKARHFSFPSGHATSFAAGGTVLAWFWVRTRPILGSFAGIAVIFLSFTRVWLGVHFPGDLLAGTLLGSWMTIGLLALWGKKLRSWTEKWKDRVNPYLNWGLYAIFTTLAVFRMYQLIQF